MNLSKDTDGKKILEGLGFSGSWSLFSIQAEIVELSLEHDPFMLYFMGLEQ